MNNYIIATAGHVDHGKTTLIQALTGKDCDTHPEEKKRGITIHLGFSHLKFNEKVSAGIIDVPGHKDFIHNMISGVCGIDLVLFVVAANEGLMPQSMEHLRIINLLGITKAIIVITKCDLVDKELLDLAEQEIIAEFSKTSLRNSPTIKVSAKNNLNLDYLKDLIIKELNTLKGNTLNENFRMYPDRLFQVKGFGSVITGSVLSGQLSKGSHLYSSNNKEFRVKRLEQYGNETDKIFKGQRTSLNLNGFEKDDYERGMSFTDMPVYKTALIDVELSLFDETPDLKLWTTIEFYSNTIQTQAKVHLLDKDKLIKGDKCLAQIHLKKSVPLFYNDRFIIRNSSNDLTLGGGVIIDAFPLHHRRRTKHVIELLRKRQTGNKTDLLMTEIEKTIKPISIKYICDKLFIKTEVFEQDLDYSSLSDKYLKKDNWFWTKRHYDIIKQRLIKYLQIGHKNNPLSNLGKTLEELASVFNETIGDRFVSPYGDYAGEGQQTFLRVALEELLNEDILDKRESTYALKSHVVELLTKDHIQINWVDQYILNQRMKAPLWSELTERAKRRDINEKRLKQILYYLVSKKRLYHHEGEYLHALNVNPLRIKLLEHLSSHENGLTVGEFRDLINANRKISLIMLNIFDSEGIVIRKDEKRFISVKGQSFLEENYSQE